MAEQKTEPAPNPQRDRQASPQPPRQPPSRPWRTEGLPQGQPAKQGRRWPTMIVWALGYLLLFGMLTLQDRLTGPQPVPYTDFKTQEIGRAHV